MVTIQQRVLYGGKPTVTVGLGWHEKVGCCHLTTVLINHPELQLLITTVGFWMLVNKQLIS
jgi:hypothetical protein